MPRIANSTGPGQLTVSVATATATPSPTPSPQRLPTPQPAKGGCVVPNAAAAIKTAAPVPEIPLDARASAKNGITQIHVRLSEAGAVLDAGVSMSSGSDGLDQIALAMAKASQYSPTLVQCKAVAGTYEFRVKFVTP